MELRLYIIDKKKLRERLLREGGSLPADMEAILNINWLFMLMLIGLKLSQERYPVLGFKGYIKGDIKRQSKSLFLPFMLLD